MVRKSPTGKVSTRGCGKGFGKNPIKGKVKQEKEKIEKWMGTHRA